MTPAVSVIVTCYNYARFLPCSLDSAFAQTFQDFEVVVIDDESTDETPQLVRRYLRDPRVRYQRIRHEGVVGAKNAGMCLARAPYLAFLDADDCWLPTKLEKQMALFRADAGLGVVYCRRLLMDEEGHNLEYEEPALHRGDVLEAMFRTNFVCFSSAVVARRVIDAVGMLEPGTSPSDDYEFWLRVAQRCRFDYVDEPLVQYRTGHASLSRRMERMQVVLRIMRSYLDERGGRAYLRPAAVRTAFAETYANLALGRRYTSRPAALAWYLRALAASPRYVPAWKGLASLFLPEAARQGLRLALGHPRDWRVRPRSDVSLAQSTAPR
jgi:glycosyltransferase involved in cell wall biosynthesis